MMYVMVIAEKGIDSTYDVMPTQMQYLDKNCIDWRLASSKFDQSNRPILSSKVKTIDYTVPFLTDHYTYLGSKF